MTLICIFLMTSDVEHVFLQLLAFCIYFFDKCLFRFFACFCKMGYVLFAIELYEFFIYFWILISSDIWFANIFCICWLSFHFVGGFFCCVKFFSLM